MTLTSGTRLGTYEILGTLGAGGMGEVYRARDLRLHREVAVKVLPSEVASSPERLARPEREARTVAGLNHPNIVTLFSVEDEDGIRFLTMELVEGQSLSNLITPGGLPLAHLLELSIPLTDALVAAHERGVIHRDLKPGNVMVTREGRVKVLDFGLAKTTRGQLAGREETIAAATCTSISREGQVTGTVPYMAPEQIRGDTVDARTDLFALGIVLYELATGRRPFSGTTWAEVGSSILRDTPEPLTRVRPELPGDFERLVTRCLEKAPRERAQSSLDVSNELRRLRRGLERGGFEKASSERVVSIAVLPFVNRSPIAEDEYFSDGLADELINVLAKIKGLRVSARASSFHFKGKDASLAEVGKTLNVATVLDGSVRKAGNRVRISVQLVKVSDGYSLWSDTYDRTLEDIFAVQDDIAQSVVKELRAALLGEETDSGTSGAVKAEVARAARGRGQNADAHRLYLQARYLLDQVTHENTANGIEYLKEALELDPGFALAWAELGRAHTYEGKFGWAPVAEGYGRARKAVERALSLEPDLAEGHAVLGWLQFHGWDFGGADRSLRRALELAPGNALVLRWAGALAASLGRLEEAIDLNYRAIEHDPLSGPAYHSLGLAHLAAHRLDESEKAFRKALELSPGRIVTRSELALVLLDEGRGEVALAVAMQEPDECLRLCALAVIHHAAGRKEDSEEAVRQMTEKYAGVMAYNIAGVHALRAEASRAFEWLERAYRQQDPVLCEVKTDYYFHSLHADPRWGAFLKKMGLEG